MKYLKMLGLAAIAAGALMAFAGAGTASATELTCTEPAGVIVMCPNPTTVHAVSEGHAVLDTIFGNIECESTVNGTANTGGPSSTETVVGSGEVTFFNCTTAVVKVLKNGTLEIHTDPNDSASDTTNGTVTSTGSEVTVETFGFHCIFTTNNTDIGTLTGSSTVAAARGVATETATFDISATIPRTGGRSGAFCGASAPWTGAYKVTTPDWLDIH